jgi:hypothetical protein
VEEGVMDRAFRLWDEKQGNSIHDGNVSDCEDEDVSAEERRARRHQKAVIRSFVEQRCKHV